MRISGPIPNYIRFSFIIFILFAVIYTVEISQNILIPILFALLVAILLNPVINYLERKKMNRMVAIFIVISLVIIFFFGLLFVIFVQAQRFSETLPGLEDKLAAMKSDLIIQISQKFHISKAETTEWLNETQSGQMESFRLKDNIFRVGQLLGSIILFPIYLILILYYKNLLLNFVYKLVDSKKTHAVEKILAKTRYVIQSYLVGLFFELIIVSILFSLGLFLLGVDYAILLGILGALLNLIPYLGATLASVIFMLVALLTISPIAAVYVFFMSLAVQFIDNNIIIPRVVASRVQINALASIIAVIIGGSLLGIPGMVLSIPLIAIAKVICDHTESMKPWGELLGTVEPVKKEFNFKGFRLFKK